MLEHALENLVKDIRHDGEEDIAVRKVLPEWMNNRLDAGGTASFGKACRVCLVLGMSVKNGL